MLTAVRARTVAAALAVPLLALTINPPAVASAATAKSAGSAATAKASGSTSPGRFTGFGFDTCRAPDQATMNELRRRSPYWGVGIYIGGQNRSCTQPDLTRPWVRTQRALGWKLLPIWVGRQSACSDATFGSRISASNAVAHRQGAVAAHQAAAAAGNLGLAKGSTLFLDIESYKNDSSACNQPVFNYLSGFNSTLKRLGWKGGLYASAATGIRSLNLIKHDFPDAYTLPTSVWIAHADGRPSTHSKYLRNSYYRHQRVKQYAIDTTRTYGNATLSLDINVIDIGGGATSPRPRPSCGVELGFARYHVLHTGSRGGQVEAAQCLLRRTHDYHGKVTGRYGKGTAVAVGRFQSSVGLTKNRVLGKATWAALNAAGSGPLLKRGSVSDRVRGLQRALTAALDQRVRQNGVFGANTTTAVRRYQGNVGLAANGIVDPLTWRALKAGRR